MDQSWRVVFRGPASPEELAALPADRMLYVTGHGVGGTESSTIWVRAPDADAAEEAVRDAMSASGTVIAPTRLPYLVVIGVPEADASALAAALTARRRGTGSIGALITEPEDGLPK